MSEDKWTAEKAIALRCATVERQAKALTRAQRYGLIRIRDLGPYAWCAGYGRAGGAVSRMFDRMEVMGLCTRPPHEITDHGRAVLAFAESASVRDVSGGTK